MAQRIQDTKQTLDELDIKGTFKADDEIGVVFTAIKEAVDEINEITERSYNEKQKRVHQDITFTEEQKEQSSDTIKKLVHI